MNFLIVEEEDMAAKKHIAPNNMNAGLFHSMNAHTASAFAKVEIVHAQINGLRLANCGLFGP